MSDIIRRESRQELEERINQWTAKQFNTKVELVRLKRQRDDIENQIRETERAHKEASSMLTVLAGRFLDSHEA